MEKLVIWGQIQVRLKGGDGGAQVARAPTEAAAAAAAD